MSKSSTSLEHIWIEKGVIKYQAVSNKSFELPISQVYVIGEYTTPLGPFADDYFIALVPPTQIYEVSNDLVAKDNFIENLEKKWESN